MSDYVTLLGAEDIRQASRNITSAAQNMNRAAENIDAALQNHEWFLDDWLLRFEAAIAKAEGREGK